MNLEYIKNISTWDSGGGVTLDLIELKDGRILAISDEIIILYRDQEDLMSGDPSADRPTLYLNS
jgi:hypothetical protein